MAAAAATATAALTSCANKRDSDIVGAGMCRTKKTKRVRSPPEEQVEAFFAAAESGLARRFAAKYNYDVVKDAPIDGRYEWVRVSP